MGVCDIGYTSALKRDMKWYYMYKYYIYIYIYIYIYKIKRTVKLLKKKDENVLK